jgi:NADP-dependent 3-hydroxy acid dehydrogenase YdfG
MQTQTILITGGAGELAQQLIPKLMQQGHTLLVVDKELEKLKHLYDQWELQFPNLCYLLPMDLIGMEASDLENLVTLIESNFDQLDGIILAAHSQPAYTPIASFDMTQWYQVLQLNLNANVHLIQHFLPLLLRSKGFIVSIGDKEVSENPAYQGAYGVAKAGLKQLMTTIANEHCEKCLRIIWAELKPFASESRLRLNPGLNPSELPSSIDMAEFLIKGLENNTENPHFGQIKKLTAHVRI